VGVNRPVVRLNRPGVTTNRSNLWRPWPPCALQSRSQTFDEAESLPVLLSSLRDCLEPLEDVLATVLVIDDNSPDGTGQLAEKCGHDLEYPRFSVRVRSCTGSERMGSGEHMPRAGSCCSTSRAMIAFCKWMRICLTTRVISLGVPSCL
jgi:hypothetical protein